jgi:hypothetical protein
LPLHQAQLGQADELSISTSPGMIISRPVNALTDSAKTKLSNNLFEEAA